MEITSEQDVAEDIDRTERSVLKEDFDSPSQEASMELHSREPAAESDDVGSQNEDMVSQDGNRKELDVPKEVDRRLPDVSNDRHSRDRGSSQGDDREQVQRRDRESRDYRDSRYGDYSRYDDRYDDRSRYGDRRYPDEARDRYRGYDEGDYYRDDRHRYRDGRDDKHSSHHHRYHDRHSRDR